MKFYLTLSVMFLVMINIALGAVGDVGVSDTAATIQPEQSSLAGMDTNSYMPGLSSQASLNQPSLSSYGNYQRLFPEPKIRLPGPSDQRANARANDGRGAGTLAAANGELRSRCEFGFRVCLTAGRCGPGNIRACAVFRVSQSSVQSSVQAALPGSSIWYYPSSVVSANRFYVQTASGFRTVGGCSFRGYLPLWADIKSSGNFFVYEWYPGRSTPSVRWWGWTGTGWKKGWFCGDVPGWHILCYNSGIWSNYIYIYVYPRGAASICAIRLLKCCGKHERSISALGCAHSS